MRLCSSSTSIMEDCDSSTHLNILTPQYFRCLAITFIVSKKHRPVRPSTPQAKPDGGCQVPPYWNPEAEPGLDWFPITMRMTVRKPMAQGLTKEGKARVETGLQPAEAPAQKSIELPSLQWNLWHGHVERAREGIEELPWEMELTAGASENRDQLRKPVRELDGYLRNHQEFLPNYGERYRTGERIAAGFLKSTVNPVVSQRMGKRPPMQKRERGAHLLLPTRTKVLNGELNATSRRWYPRFLPEMPVTACAHDSGSAAKPYLRLHSENASPQQMVVT